MQVKFILSLFCRELAYFSSYAPIPRDSFGAAIQILALTCGMVTESL